MKALSLWQPWASLIAVGAKRYETRSWPTKYRGPLLICAAKKCVPKKLLREISQNDEAWNILKTIRIHYGKALAIGELVDCIPTEKMTAEQIGPDAPFGDFSPGRYAWKLENVWAFKEPFPFRGAQGLFEVPDSLNNLIKLGGGVARTQGKK